MTSYDNWLEEPYYRNDCYMHDRSVSESYDGIIYWFCPKCGEIQAEVHDPDWDGGMTEEEFWLEHAPSWTDFSYAT